MTTSPKYIVTVKGRSGVTEQYFYTVKSARHYAKMAASNPLTRLITLVGPDIRASVLFNGENK